MTPEARARWMAARVKHGAYANGKETSEHAIWRGIVARCGNPKTKDYARYGGRGITVCESWMRYENFIADMGPRPSKEHSVERRKNDEGYSPCNCYWATRSEQQKNKTNTIWYEYEGRVGTLVDWAQWLGISVALACWRIKTWGTFEKGVTWQLQSQKSKRS